MHTVYDHVDDSVDPNPLIFTGYEFTRRCLIYAFLQVPDGNTGWGTPPVRLTSDMISGTQAGSNAHDKQMCAFV